jgi:hypothetical protein
LTPRRRSLPSSRRIFLYTTEAFRRYLDVLRPGGVIFLTRPRAQLLRAVTAAVAALRERGVTDVGRHIVVLADSDLLSAAIYVDPLTPAQATTFAEQVKAGALDATLQYAPGLEVESNLASDYFAALGAGQLTDFEQRHRVRTDPATDDEPYFYLVEPAFIGSIASQVIALLLFLLVGIGIVLILVPLLRLKLPDKNRLVGGHFIYFGCLGLGFMLVEIACNAATLAGARPSRVLGERDARRHVDRVRAREPGRGRRSAQVANDRPARRAHGVSGRDRALCGDRAARRAGCARQSDRSSRTLSRPYSRLEASSWACRFHSRCKASKALTACWCRGRGS